MNDLNVTLIQTNLHWENITANLAMLEEKIWQVKKPVDVIVLPEMFSTGFSMNAPALAEMMNMKTTKWMKQMADHTDALILGSFIAKENGTFFNRLVLMEPGGRLLTYDKRHTFRMAHEDKTYRPGDKNLVASWRGWNICPLICYDLRFPVWSRNTWNPESQQVAYDLLIYVANWPEARVFAWDSLLKARAIENLAYVVGVNRTGPDGNGFAHNGHSVALDFKGSELAACGEVEVIRTVTLRKEELHEYRRRFSAHLDADRFQIL